MLIFWSPYNLDSGNITKIAQYVIYSNLVASQVSEFKLSPARGGGVEAVSFYC